MKRSNRNYGFAQLSYGAVSLLGTFFIWMGACALTGLIFKVMWRLFLFGWRLL
jgi:hypothetical protein